MYDTKCESDFLQLYSSGHGRLFQCLVVKFTKIRFYRNCRIEMWLIGETRYVEVLNLVRCPAGYPTRHTVYSLCTRVPYVTFVIHMWHPWSCRGRFSTVALIDFATRSLPVKFHLKKQSWGPDWSPYYDPVQNTIRSRTLCKYVISVWFMTAYYLVWIEARGCLANICP